MSDKCERCGTGREPVLCMTCALEMAEFTLQDACRVPEVQMLVKFAREAIRAIATLPEDALGMAQIADRYEWSIRDEVLSVGKTVLAPFEEPTDAT